MHSTWIQSRSLCPPLKRDGEDNITNTGHVREFNNHYKKKWSWLHLAKTLCAALFEWTEMRPSINCDGQAELASSVLNYLRAVKGGGWSKTAAQSSRPSVRVVMTLIKSETVRTGGAFKCTAAVGGLQLLEKTTNNMRCRRISADVAWHWNQLIFPHCGRLNWGYDRL